MKIVHECPGLKLLIKNGAVIKRIANIDEKGDDITYCLKSDRGNVMIRHCPCCGGQISNLQVPSGECSIERCGECNTILKDALNDTYCPRCEAPPISEPIYDVDPSGGIDE